MLPFKGLYTATVTAIVLLAGAHPSTMVSPEINPWSRSESIVTTENNAKSQIEGLAKEAVTRFSQAVRESNATTDNKASADAELRAVVDMSDILKKLQTLTRSDPSLSSMATMQGVIGLQSALVNYAIYDMTLDEDILATGRRSADNAMRLLAASVQLSKQDEGTLPEGKNQL